MVMSVLVIRTSEANLVGKQTAVNTVSHGLKQHFKASTVTTKSIFIPRDLSVSHPTVSEISLGGIKQARR